ncbi:DciA family protein [Streptomyces sp. NPDC091383]|uniref:DciA family protein n=1 Tax=Streptomyces sp. NPDC091383 TaxID=3365996 RepID=UPI00382758A6
MVAPSARARRPPAGRRCPGGDRVNAVPELSGVDLARQALLAARAAAKKNGAQTKKPKRRTGATLRRDGREPVGLGAAITMMMTERSLVAPAAGGSVLAHWEAILAAAAPELAGHVQAVKYDTDSGRMDVAPDAPAWGTKVRWIAPKLIAAANEKALGANVRTLHVLPPVPWKASPVPAADVPAAPPAPTVPEAFTGSGPFLPRRPKRRRHRPRLLPYDRRPPWSPPRRPGARVSRLSCGRKPSSRKAAASSTSLTSSRPTRAPETGSRPDRSGDFGGRADRRGLGSRPDRPG